MEACTSVVYLSLSTPTPWAMQLCNFSQAMGWLVLSLTPWIFATSWLAIHCIRIEQSRLSILPLLHSFFCFHQENKPELTWAHLTVWPGNYLRHKTMGPAEICWAWLRFSHSWERTNGGCFKPPSFVLFWVLCDVTSFRGKLKAGIAFLEKPQ